MRFLFALAIFFGLSFSQLQAREIGLEQKISSLYISFFNRAADEGGLTYWTNLGVAAEQRGEDPLKVLKQLANGFALHPTFVSTYGHMNNEEFVQAIYRNSLGREGDPGGIAYWKGLLDAGKSRPDMVAEFMNLSLTLELIAENFPTLSTAELSAAQERQDLITNKVEVAVHFTTTLNVRTNVVDTQDPENDPAYKASIKVIADVTLNIETVIKSKAKIDIIKEQDDPIAAIDEKWGEINTSGDELGSYVFEYPPSPLGLGDTELSVGSKVEGIVRSAVSGSSLGGVSVSLNASEEQTTSSDGSYKFDNITSSTYTMNFTKSGYKPATYTLSVTEPRVYTLDTVLFIPATFTGLTNLSGNIKDAQTGDIISDATLKVREGLNKRKGTVYKIASLSSSEYSLNLDKTYYTIEVSKPGYITEYYNISAYDESQTKDLAISPIINEDQYRVVLTWGETPSDLDSHLARYENGTFKYHVYYENQEGSISYDEAQLDTDDVSSYGPETITFNDTSGAKYKYYIHDYTNKYESSSSALSRSGAKVTVYHGNSTTVYYPPASAGTVWEVFTIENGYLSLCSSNCMRYESSASNVTPRYMSKEVKLFSSLPEK